MRTHHLFHSKFLQIIIILYIENNLSTNRLRYIWGCFVIKQNPDNPFKNILCLSGWGRGRLRIFSLIIISHKFYKSFLKDQEGDNLKKIKNLFKNILIWITSFKQTFSHFYFLLDKTPLIASTFSLLNKKI